MKETGTNLNAQMESNMAYFNKLLGCILWNDAKDTLQKEIVVFETEKIYEILVLLLLDVKNDFMWLFEGRYIC